MGGWGMVHGSHERGGEKLRKLQATSSDVTLPFAGTRKEALGSNGDRQDDIPLPPKSFHCLPRGGRQSRRTIAGSRRPSEAPADKHLLST